VRFTPGIHLVSLVDLGVLQSQDFTRLNLDSTRLSLALPLLMLYSNLLKVALVAHALLMPDQAYSGYLYSAPVFCLVLILVLIMLLIQVPPHLLDLLRKSRQFYTHVPEHAPKRGQIPRHSYGVCRS
jgi:hypothetical protein